MRRRRAHKSLALAAAATLACSNAIAGPDLDAAFVALLSPPDGRRHPMADASGKLAVVVETPVFADARTMGLLPLGPGLATLRLWPRDLAHFEATHPDLRFSIWPPLHPVLDESARVNGTLAYRAALATSGSAVRGTGKGVVIGIVDSGLDVTHPDFLDAAGNTRVAWMLDYSHPALGKHPELEAAFGCADALQAPCAVLERADITAALGGTAGAYLPRDTLGHGTHVTSIAAGNGGQVSPRFVGGAPEATLVVINVSQGPDGGSSDVDIAAGARFVFERAAALGMPAVLNLSLGSDFGPHDGTTPLEKALGQWVGADHPGRAIVAAAGNSGVLFQSDPANLRFGVHTQTRVTNDLPARAVLRGFANGPAATIGGTTSIWLTFGPTDDISVALEGPGGLAIAPVGAGNKASDATSDNGLRAAVYNRLVDPATSLTADTHGALVVWSGEWSADSEAAIRFEGEGFVDAWVEAAPDGTTGSFEELFEVATREGTINVPATSPDLIAVGCTVNRASWTDVDLHDHDVAASPAFDLLSPDDSLCYFSSGGPSATGVTKPEISAPGGLIAAAMSADARPGQGHPSLFDAPPEGCPDGNECMVVDPTHAILSGSSMSSPQVAGAIALLFERDASLTAPDALLLLQQGARRPRGTVGTDYQLGPGALSIDGAMAALEARAVPIVRDPDAAASWMSLSTGSVRPGGISFATGNVEIRASDGSLSDGFDPSRLSLEVSREGWVARPLTRVAAGLYRFEVRAQPGTGATAMDVVVRIDGVAIGEQRTRLSGDRSLPIGADRWIALGSGRAYGGCSMSSHPSGNAAWVVVGLAWLAWRRRQGEAMVST